MTIPSFEFPLDRAQMDYSPLEGILRYKGRSYPLDTLLGDTRSLDAKIESLYLKKAPLFNHLMPKDPIGSFLLKSVTLLTGAVLIATSSLALSVVGVCLVALAIFALCMPSWLEAAGHSLSLYKPEAYLYLEPLKGEQRDQVLDILEGEIKASLTD